MDTRDAYRCLDQISAPVFVLEISAEGVPVYAAFNTHALQMSGRPLSDYIGRTAEEVYPQAFGRTAFARHCEVVARAAPVTYQVELPVGDLIRTVRTTLRPELDEKGRVLRLYGTSKDMTVEKQALEAKIQFDTLSSEMEQFVALAAHDLRAPMRHMATLADMLREDFNDMGDGKIELIDMMENIAMKSMDLISDVLSHAEIGTTGPIETVFSFPALCQDICDVIDPQSQHVITTSSATVNSDRTAMQIALRNVTENALKHGEREQLTINIAVQQGLPGMIEVTLTDNGRGFSDAALKVMNGGRFQVGSGYGLFGVKRLISARGGTLVARNLPEGHGAVVRFSLPGDLIGAAAMQTELNHQTTDAYRAS